MIPRTRATCVAGLCTLLLCVFPAFQSAALPPVDLDAGCPLVQNLESNAAALLGLALEPGQDVTTADIELGTGDGVPDYFQLMLLDSALCSGDAGLNGTFAANRAVIVDYVAVVGDLVEFGLTARQHAATASQELDLFMAWPLYAMLIPVEIQSYVTMLDEALASFLEATALLEDPGQADALLAQLDSITDILAGTAGLSTEMRASVAAAVEQLLADVFAYQPELASMADALDMAASMVGALFFYDRIEELQGSLAVLAGDLRTADGLIQRLHFPMNNIIIYTDDVVGGEPFSGLGDYDGDGTTNSEVYTITNGCGRGVASFVKAASGADPFYNSDSLPAAGIIGLAALGAIIAVAGALVIFRRPRR